MCTRGLAWSTATAMASVSLSSRPSMTAGGHGNTYSVRVPRDLPQRTFGECQTAFGRDHGATVLAMRTGEELLVSPAWDTPVPEGATLYYVASQRLDEARLGRSPHAERRGQ